MAFSSLLLHLKMTFQLGDLVVIPESQQWLKEMGDATLLVWGAWCNEQATLLLLKFWSGISKARRTPASTPAEQEADLQIIRLALRFLQAQCETKQRDEEEDDAIVVSEQLENYEALFRHDITVTLPAFETQFDRAFASKSSRCLVWLVALGTQLIAQQRAPSNSVKQGQVDAEIAFRVLQLLEQPQLQVRPSVQAQVIAFLDELRQTYIVDGNRILSSNQQTAIDTVRTILRCFVPSEQVYSFMGDYQHCIRGQ
jgi:hypothetical protein